MNKPIELLRRESWLDVESMPPEDDDIDLAELRDRTRHLKEKGEIFHRSRPPAIAPVIHEAAFGVLHDGHPKVHVHLMTAQAGIQGEVQELRIFTRAGGAGLEETATRVFATPHITAGAYREAYAQVLRQAVST